MTDQEQRAGELVEREWTDERGTHYEARIVVGDKIVSKMVMRHPQLGWLNARSIAVDDVRRAAAAIPIPPVSGLMRSMTDPPDTFARAIGDLSVARRHLERLRMGELQAGPMVLNEIQEAVLRCVARLERMSRA